MTSLYKINLGGSNPSLGTEQVWAKMENQNPTGTHKDRSMKPWIAHCAKRGITELAISSSGNSAISAAKFCNESGIKLNVFVSPHIDSGKLARIKKYLNIILYITKTPNRDAFRFCRERNILSLRASKDDAALAGYEDIVFELTQQLPRIDNIFVPTSSGATLQGMYMAYHDMNLTRTVPVKFKMPAFYVVQTAKVHPIASYFDKDFVDEETSYATAIVDQVAHRKNKVLEIVKRTGGGGFVISNKELKEAIGELKNSNITGSDPAARGSDPDSLKFGWQSILAFAGFLRWQTQNPKIAANKISVCIFTD